MEWQSDMPVNLAATLLTFYYLFTRCSLYRGDVKNVIDDAERALKDGYGCTQGLMWIYVRASMGAEPTL